MKVCKLASDRSKSEVVLRIAPEKPEIFTILIGFRFFRSNSLFLANDSSVSRTLCPNTSPIAVIAEHTYAKLRF